MARNIVFVLVCLTHIVLGDLPVHCLHSEVAGKWILYLDEGGKGNDLACGHSMPDRDDDHKDHVVRLSVQKPAIVEIELQEPSVVTASTGERGHWTMVYDEGFEITINNHKYFAFSHYHTNPTDPSGSNVNDCDRTFVGWYHDVNGTNWGCYYGVKQGAVPLPDVPIATRSKRPEALEDQWAKDIDFESINNQASVKSNFSDFPSFLEVINSAQSSFSVKYHEHLQGRTFDELRMMAGNSFIQTEMQLKPLTLQAHSRTTSGSFNISELPTKWDWRSVNGQNFDSPFKYQGFCGSCYSMATVQMLETRIRVQTNNTHRPVLSSQDAVSCSRFNQGCDGGYPFLVAKYAQDFGIVSEQCLPYSPGSECSQKCKTPEFKVRTSEYYYVGGYYGGCTEAAMMQELYENGPFVVSFNAGSDFMFYSGGVYTTTQWSDSFLEISETTGTRVRPWEKTTHSVLLVGYGESSDGKYWIAKNTWGAQWGENGYFRIRRGTDESAFESMSLAAKPILELARSSVDVNQDDHIKHRFADSPSTTNMIEEEEGQDSQLESLSNQESAVRNVQVVGLEHELDSFHDPNYSKDYTPLRRPHLTNDLSADLHSDPHKINDILKQVHEEENQQQQQQQQPQPHHHHHHHHSHTDSSDNHHHHHHHHHTDQDVATPSIQNDLIQNIQLDEGRGEFADPADEM